MMRSARTIEAQATEPKSRRNKPDAADPLAEDPRIVKAGSEQALEQLLEKCEEQDNCPPQLKPFVWKKGQSGNPGGRPKRDYAAELARAIIEENPTEVYHGMLAQLKKGSGYVYQVLSDRGYGKLKETMEVSGSVDLVERLRAGRKRVAEGK